jgi:hypothetical protein
LDAYLVGSAPQALLDGKIPKDYDVIIPLNKTERLLLLLKDRVVRFNSSGAFRVVLDEETSVDIWPEYLHDHIDARNSSGPIYRPKKDQLITFS